MLYNCLKIIHILSAGLLITSMVYSFRLWKLTRLPRVQSTALRIQSQTGFIIVPCAILQLGTGFSMISLHHENISTTWISGSIIGFIVVISSWFAFLYFLLLSQQQPEAMTRFRRIQSIMLMICTFALLSMVFLMSNKIV